MWLQAGSARMFSRHGRIALIPVAALDRKPTIAGGGPMRRIGNIVLYLCAAVLLMPGVAAAQASISGLVQDASGAVLPGVTVEASSPALIEKARTAVTDGAGRFSIVDLRPGTYDVTFSLTGFSTVKREGIVLSGTFDAQVNADLRVGSLQETVTVSGASPVVDVRNNITQAVLTKEEIETLPGSRTLKGRAALIAGVSIPGGNTGAVAHGSDSQDSHTMVDGFKSGQHLVGRGTGQLGVGSVTQSQEAAVEELVYSTDSQGAEYAFSGVRMNLIPKEGANQTRIEGIAYGSNQHFERNNLGDLQTGPAPLKYAPRAVLLRLQSGDRWSDQTEQAVVFRVRERHQGQQPGSGRLFQAG